LSRRLPPGGTRGPSMLCWRSRVAPGTRGHAAITARGGTPVMLRDHPTGNYRYLPGISAFSSGTVAMPGHEIVHLTLGGPVPWRDGFARIDHHLRDVGRPRTALCGIEPRSPAPFTFDGFAMFNEGYRALLGDWGILVGDDNPIPRTNVAPVA